MNIIFYGYDDGGMLRMPVSLTSLTSLFHLHCCKIKMGANFCYMFTKQIYLKLIYSPALSSVSVWWFKNAQISQDSNRKEKHHFCQTDAERMKSALT